MTATVLRTAQSRLAEEREQRLRARAAEELAMVDMRRAKDEAAAIRDQQRESDRQLSKALHQQRRELEDTLRRQQDENEVKIAQMYAEKEKQVASIHHTQEKKALELEKQLHEALMERDRLLEEQKDMHAAQTREMSKAAEAQAKMMAQSMNGKLEEEKEKRIQHLQQLGVRRIVQQTLFKGWSTWREIYEQRTKRKRLLQQAANRLMKPALVAALKHWETDWKAKQMKRAKMSLEEQLAEERALRQAAEARLAEVQAELTAAKEELKKGRGLDASVKQDLESQLEAERQARVEHLANVGIRRIMQQGIAKGWSAWRSSTSTTNGRSGCCRMRARGWRGRRWCTALRTGRMCDARPT